MAATGTVTLTTTTGNAPRYLWTLAGAAVPNTPINLLNMTPTVGQSPSPIVIGETLTPANVTAALQAAYEAGYTEGSTP